MTCMRASSVVHLFLFLFHRPPEEDWTKLSPRPIHFALIKTKICTFRLSPTSSVEQIRRKSDIYQQGEGRRTEHEHQHTGVDMDVVFCPICTHVIRTHKSHLHAITIIIIGISNKSCQPPVPTLSADYHPFCRIPIYFHYSLPILKGLPIPLGFCFSHPFSNTIFHLRSSKPCEQ